MSEEARVIKFGITDSFKKKTSRHLENLKVSGPLSSRVACQNPPWNDLNSKSICSKCWSVSERRPKGAVNSRYGHIRACIMFTLDRWYSSPSSQLCFLGSRVSVWFCDSGVSLLIWCIPKEPFLTKEASGWDLHPLWDIIPGTTSKQTPTGTAAVSVADGERVNNTWRRQPDTTAHPLWEYVACMIEIF